MQFFVLTITYVAMVAMVAMVVLMCFLCGGVMIKQLSCSDKFGFTLFHGSKVSYKNLKFT